MAERLTEHDEHSIMTALQLRDQRSNEQIGCSAKSLTMSSSLFQEVTISLILSYLILLRNNVAQQTRARISLNLFLFSGKSSTTNLVLILQIRRHIFVCFCKFKDYRNNTFIHTA